MRTRTKGRKGPFHQTGRAKGAYQFLNKSRSDEMKVAVAFKPRIEVEMGLASQRDA